MSSYGVVGRVGVLVEPTFKGVQRKVKDGLGVPLANEGTHQGTNLGNSIVAGTTRVFKWGGVAVGAALGTAITKGFGRLRAMEDATAKIEGLGYSAKEVDQIMTDVQGALDGTMFLYSEGADVAAGALAAGIKEGEELESYLRLTADAATQANVEYGAMGQMMNKVASSGRLTGDVLNQLEQNGVYVGAAIADSLGVTQEEFRKMVSQGEVSAEVFQEVMEEQFGGSSEKAAETLTGAMSLAWTAVGQFGEKLVQDVKPYLKDFFTGFYDWVQEISPAVEDFGKRVGEAIGNIIGWIRDNPGVVKAFAAAIGAVFAAMAAYTVVVKVQDAINGLKNAFKGLNAMMAANPVAIWAAAIAALVVGLIWAYNNVDWFRNAVQVAWDAITTAFTWAWENVIQPVIGWIGDAWNWLADVFVAAWDNYLSPMFEGIGAVAVWLWESVLQPVIGFIVSAWQAMVDAMAWAWENILKPVWDTISTVIQWLWTAVLFVVFTAIWTQWQIMSNLMKAAWEYVLKPVWDAIVSVALWLWNDVLSPVFTWIGEKWQLVLLGMQLYWQRVLKPVWEAIVAVATWLWTDVLQPVFTWIGDKWQQVLDGMKWVWDRILKPVWDALVSTAEWLWYDILEPIFGWIAFRWDHMSAEMQNVYNRYIKPLFDRFGEIVENLRDKFDTAVENIKKAWNKVKEVAAKPIHFVIDRVINKGLIEGFNSLIGLIPFMDMEVSKVPIPGWMSEFGFARGGWTGPGSKYQPAGIVHADEYVLNKEATNKLRAQVGLSGLDYMNETGRFPGYASGGLVRPVDGPLTSRFGSRWGGTHAGVDWAVPVGTPVKAALPGTVARAGRNVVSGRTGLGMLLAHEGNRNTYYGHLSKLVARVGETVAKGQNIALSGNTGNSTGPHLHFETWTGGRPVDPLSHMGGLPASADGGSGWFDPLAPLRALGEKIGGWFAERFPEGGFLVDAAKQTATGALDKIIDWVGGIIGMNGDNEGGGTGPVKDQVRDVAAKYGWDSGEQWSALSTLIQRESSWNPNAANPSSSARGLFQKMTSIHGPVESTAAAQAEWGLKYIRDRYYSPRTALDFHNRRGYYADGGLVTANPLFRDRGGNLPPGLSMVLNKTGRDEAILNSRQWADIHTLAQRGSGGPGVHIENAYALSHKELARDIATEQRRAKALQLI